MTVWPVTWPMPRPQRARRRSLATLDAREEEADPNTVAFLTERLRAPDSRVGDLREYLRLQRQYARRNHG